MLKTISIFPFFTLMCATLGWQSLSAQNAGASEVWKTLSKVSFESVWDEELEYPVQQPKFSDEILALDGKEITIRGYLLPEKGYKTHKEFILSSLPYNLCYFCGKAGPETVMEISALDAVRYTSDTITLRGTLMLNFLDPIGLPYALLDARLVK